MDYGDEIWERGPPEWPFYAANDMSSDLGLQYDDEYETQVFDDRMDIEEEKVTFSPTAVRTSK